MNLLCSSIILPCTIFGTNVSNFVYKVQMTMDPFLCNYNGLLKHASLYYCYNHYVILLLL